MTISRPRGLPCTTPPVGTEDHRKCHRVRAWHFKSRHCIEFRPRLPCSFTHPVFLASTTSHILLGVASGDEPVIYLSSAFPIVGQTRSIFNVGVVSLNIVAIDATTLERRAGSGTSRAAAGSPCSTPGTRSARCRSPLGSPRCASPCP